MMLDTHQDNQAYFGPISPLPIILGNVPITLVDLNIILSDFPVVRGIFNMLNIYDQKS